MKKTNAPLATLLALFALAFCAHGATTPTEAVSKYTLGNALTADLWSGAHTIGVSSGGTLNYATGASFAGNAAEFRDDVGLEIGADVQAYGVNLEAIRGLASAANKLPYFTGSGAAALADYTAAARTFDALSSAQAQVNALWAATGTLAQGDLLYYNGTNVVRLAAGTAGKTLTTNGAGANPSWEAVSVAMPRSYLAGLTLSNNGADATNDINVATGACRSSANTYDLALVSPITKRLDAAWSVGTDQGGLDTGTAADGTYHAWLIKRSDTGVVDVLFSASASSPTMPTSYDAKRRIGSIVRAGGAIKAFIQRGDYVWYTDGVSDVTAVATGTSAQTKTLTVPTGIEVIAMITATSSATTGFLPTSLSQSDAAGFTTNGAAILSTTSSANFQTLTNTSGQIRTRTNVNVNLTLITQGYIDRRGRDD